MLIMIIMPGVEDVCMHVYIENMPRRLIHYGEFVTT